MVVASNFGMTFPMISSTVEEVTALQYEVDCGLTDVTVTAAVHVQSSSLKQFTNSFAYTVLGSSRARCFSKPSLQTVDAICPLSTSAPFTLWPVRPPPSPLRLTSAS